MMTCTALSFALITALTNPTFADDIGSDFGTVPVGTTFVAGVPDVLARAGEPEATVIAIIGLDGTNCYMPVAPSLGAAGHEVHIHPQVSSLDSLDLSGYDVVWMASGIDADNPSCGGHVTIPSATGEQNLRTFAIAGGKIMFLGEDILDDSGQFIVWRDQFIHSLGGGTVNGLCECHLGTTIHLDTSLPISTTPNPTDTIGATSQWTGGFHDIGNGTSFAFGTPELTGMPVAVFWDLGDLTQATDARIIAFNNTNNTSDFQSWSVNAVAFLLDLGTCPTDIDDNGMTDVGDLLAVLGGWGTPAGDVTSDGMTDVSDVLAILSAWGPCD